MEITTLGKDSLKIKGKQGSLVIDPASAGPKTEADAVLFLTSMPKHSVSTVEGQRLEVWGAGEYEVSGIKISAMPIDSTLGYQIRMDSLHVFVTKGEALSSAPETMADNHIVVLSSTQSINESAVTAISPRVVVLYGAYAQAAAKLLGKEAVSVKKYQTTIEKLPEEMEVVVLE